jgi:hypothetical protein
MCEVSKSFQFKHRTEIQDFGSYKPGILYGSFSPDDIELVFAYCQKCDYTAMVADSSSKTIRVENKITGRWGWIKKLWACIDPGTDLYAAQFVYGFFKDNKWRVKYCINENFFSIRQRIDAKFTGDQLDNSVWPYIIYLPELETKQVRQKIAILRGSYRNHQIIRV